MVLSDFCPLMLWSAVRQYICSLVSRWWWQLTSSLPGCLWTGPQNCCTTLSSCPPKLLHDVVFLPPGQQKAQHCHSLNKNTHHFAQLPTLQKMLVVEGLRASLIADQPCWILQHHCCEVEKVFFKITYLHRLCCHYKELHLHSREFKLEMWYS